MLLSRKNQYCENDYTTKHNLQIQYDPYKITNGTFHRTKTKNFIIHMEIQIIPNSQSSLEKEEWNWRNQSSWLQTNIAKLQSSRQYGTGTKSEREIKESVPFTIATKRTKYLGMNLPKETKELYTENYKTLMKEIKDDINRWKDIPCS